MSQSDVVSATAMDDYAQALEGYVIPPIPIERYTPKLDTGASRYKDIFPRRPGSKPLTTRHEPHQQITQHGKADLWDEFIERSASLPDVTINDSLVSVPGAQGLFLDKAVAKGPKDAFMVEGEGEFAHIHTRPDGSIHLMLPLDLAALAMGAGWGEPHTYVFRGLDQPNSIMLYAARTPEELDVIWMLVQESYRYARGEPAQFTIAPVLIGD